LPIPHRQKKPAIDEWQKLRLVEQDLPRYFNGQERNIGVLLGEPYGNSDVDLDSVEAIRLWPVWAPPTNLIFGRKSKPRSHYFYRTDPPARSLKFRDPLQPPPGQGNDDRATFLELRSLKKDGSVGLQTVVPPSTHESGELVRFDCDGEPANIDASVLVLAVATTAAAALLVRYWPPNGGGRHDAMLALAGILARAGWKQNDAQTFCRAVYHALPNPDSSALNRSDGEVADTFANYSSGKAITGFRTLAEKIDPKVLTKVLQWLGIKPHPQPTAAAATADSDWPVPEALQGALPPVDSFDPALLPQSLRPLVVDSAERMQVPIDFPAVVATLCLAGVVSRRASIQPKVHDNSWIVTPNLWGGIIGRPGLMKSPTLKAIAHPVEQLQALWYQEYQAALADYAHEREECDLRQAAWREAYKSAAKKKGDPPIRPDDSLPEPVLRRLLLNDTTYEKAHETMRDNPAGILVVRDELSGWLAQLDRQGREGEREFWLTAWNGDDSFVIDRIGRGTIYVPHLCMSLLGGIQPARLRSYLTDTLFDGPANDGLMQRFQVLVWPDASAEWMDVDRVPDVRAGEQAARVFRRLVELDLEEPARLSFAPNAQALFVKWRTALEYKLRSGELHPALESHLAKYRSLNPSLAGLFSLADGAAAGELPSQISMAHEQQAILWCGYLESHARRVYSCIVSPQMRAARDLADRIKQRKVGADGVLSLRDIYLKGWSGLDDPQQAKAAVDVLVDACWLRRINAGSQDPFGRGRPSDRYATNPRIWA
jgi:putative DNA primase/helicase